MLHKMNLEHVLFLDIETFPAYPNFADLDAEEKTLWEQKTT